MAKVNDWKNKAACRDCDDPEVFFPEVQGRERWIRAQAYCDTCPVTEQCLWMQLRACEPVDDRWGMFGGLSPSGRKRFREQMWVKQELGLPRRNRVKRDDGTARACEG